MKSRLLIAVPVAAATLVGCGSDDAPDLTFREAVRGVIDSDGTVAIQDDDGVTFLGLSGDTLEGPYLEADNQEGTRVPELAGP